MSGKERLMILAHEGNHLRHAHALWSLLESVLAAVLWFTPLPHLLRRGGTRIREILCDDAVTRTHPRLAYGRLLLRTATRAAGVALPSFAQGWLGRGALSSRVRILLHIDNPRTRAPARVAAGLAVVACVLLLVACLPHVPTGADLGARNAAASLDPGLSEGFPGAARTPLYGSIGFTAADNARMTPGAGDNLISLRFESSTAFASVLAPTAGTIVEIRRDAEGLYGIELRSANGYTIHLGNLESVLAKAGDVVNPGRMLGRAAADPDTGAVSLVHYEVELGSEYVDPAAMVWLPKLQYLEYQLVASTTNVDLVHAFGTVTVTTTLTLSGMGYTPSRVVDTSWSWVYATRTDTAAPTADFSEESPAPGP